MDEKEKKPTDSNTISSETRGETMAFALQSGLFSLAANAFEPYINMQVQRKYAHLNPGHNPYGTYKQNLIGELVGDIGGASTLMAAEALIPTQLHTCTRSMRRFVDPLYKSVAHVVFADERGTPGYDKKVEQWATFHERNLARSIIVLAGGVSANLATQKLLLTNKNPSPTKVIFAGKMLSAAVTSSLGLFVRFMIPNQMKSLDSWMAKKYFVPRMEDKSLLGEQATHTDKVEQRRDMEGLVPSR